MSMKSLTRIGIGLSVVFTCLLFALVAEIYYLLWWKRRIIMNNREIKVDNNDRREFCFKFCWKKPYKSSLDSTRVADAQFHQHQIQQENNKQDYFVKPLEGDNENGVVEGELMIMGPPRFLFTINEETKEDLLESEDRKSKSLNDLLNKNNNNNTISSNATISPYLTPISSPPILTPVSNHSSQSGGGGYNPWYEASSDAEFNKMVKVSPPLKFKFLRDAEEKLQRKLILMEEAKLERDLHQVKNENENGSFISVVVDDNDNNKDDKTNHYYHFLHSHYSGDSSSISTSTSCSSSSTLASSSSRKFKSFLTM